MTYAITILRTAVKSVERLPKAEQERVVDAITELAEKPRPAGFKKLSGRDALRIRVGHYRIIYEVDDAAKTIQVVVISHRKDAYRP